MSGSRLRQAGTFRTLHRQKDVPAPPPADAAANARPAVVAGERGLQDDGGQGQPKTVGVAKESPG